MLTGRFVIIGYGSLLWDLEILEPHVEHPWLLNGGPPLPMEFSRVSPKRKMGLVVVMDPDNGIDCETHVIASLLGDIHATAEDLRARERAKSIEHIGAVCMRTGFERSTYAHLATRVRQWCARENAAGAVWTDLSQNFAAATGQPFSLDNALAYLKTLRGEHLAEAVRYIDNAPEQTNTPLRRMLRSDPWWQALERS
ncbi:MAG: hypothetical protein GKR94_24020 [Gammaproteobacteria bacterium]|nr:hypothetical protein [Gammaproteobacteria bacterium]